jgi:hypothetical protein
MTAEEQLLQKYSQQLKQLDGQVRDLMRQRNAIMTIIQGLQVLTGKTEPASAMVQESRAANPRESGTVLGAAVELLRTVKPGHTMGAAIISELLARRGRHVNYHTLYKGLRREAARSNGLIYREGEGFGLREWRETKSPKSEPLGR